MISHSVETPRGTGAFFLIPSVFFVSSPPDKVGYFPRAFDFFLNPSVFLNPNPKRNKPKNKKKKQKIVVAAVAFFNPSVF